ncbi:hypothetical protein A2U01_0063662, partial [Trifolium medium]|nr:hypothetical protein [Trifolium medium]
GSGAMAPPPENDRHGSLPPEMKNTMKVFLRETERRERE